MKENKETQYYIIENIVDFVPRYTDVFVTADTYSMEESTLPSGIVDNTKFQKLKDVQTIVALGEMARGLSAGQQVLINFQRYEKPIHSKDSTKSTMDEYYKVNVKIEVPMFELNGRTLLKLNDNDVIMAVKTEQIKEPVKTPVVETIDKSIIPTATNEDLERVIKSQEWNGAAPGIITSSRSEKNKL